MKSIHSTNATTTMRSSMPITDHSTSRGRRSLFVAVSVSGLLMLGACVETMPKLPIAVANFSATAADLEGTWSGTYICSQGPTAVRLLLKPSGPQTVEGRYDFFNLPGHSNSASGSFTVAGTVALGQLTLKPGSWIVRPPNYLPLNVSVAVFNNPDRLVGNVTDRGCGRFEVARTSQPVGASMPAALVIEPARTTPAPAAATRAPAPVAAVSSTATTAVSAPRGIGHAEFVKRLGSQKLPSLVGTTLQLNLRRGGDGGWKGYVEDAQSMVFFTCQTAAPGFNGGQSVAKISKLTSNDKGVFVTLDRCGA